MTKLTIDNQPIDVPAGTTVLQAARQLGIDIPTLCYLEGRPAINSCMVCLVKVNGGDTLLPSCGLIAQESMVVESQTDQVIRARRAALELLLSDHLGDCIGPCQMICPANMNIPLMIRQVATGRPERAIETIKCDIAIPAVLGRICPAPCEKGCRRRQADSPVSICLLKRYAADADLSAKRPYRPDCAESIGKAVAIVGAGPAGISAAYYLARAGHACTVFDAQDVPGGALRSAVSHDRLPPEVLQGEIDLICELSVTVRSGCRVGEDVSLDDLQRDFDAVLLATGRIDQASANRLGAAWRDGRVCADNRTYRTETSDIFAAGGAIRPKSKLAVRSAADGKEAAICIDQYLRGREVTGPDRPFNVRIGRLLAGEIDQFLNLASRSGRVEPSIHADGFTSDQARAESLRCLHCDCRKADSCRLREHCQALGANPDRYKSSRRGFVQNTQHPDVIYEPGKCIKCGICVRLASEHREPLGLTFIGRGFDVRVGAPMNRSLSEALTKAATACVRACPTGALAFRDDRD